jgi:hypothetical protein
MTEKLINKFKSMEFTYYVNSINLLEDLFNKLDELNSKTDKYKYTEEIYNITSEILELSFKLYTMCKTNEKMKSLLVKCILDRNSIVYKLLKVEVFNLLSSEENNHDI